MNCRRIAAVAAKEWRETVRDRTFLTLAFLIPILWMLVFGYGMVLDVEDVPLAVLDLDRTPLSRDYAYRFMSSRYFDFKGYVRDQNEIDALLLRNDIRAAVVVPEQFEERLIAGEPVSVQTLLDGMFPLRADIAKSYIIAINAAVSQELVAKHLTRLAGYSPEQAERLAQPVKLEVRYLFNQEARSTWTIVPALVMFTLSLSPPLLTALGVVREKERGSIYNIYSASVTRFEFLVGKLTPYVCLSAMNVVVLWLMAVVIFGVPFKGDWIFFYVASFLFVLCTTGIGLIISLLVNTQQAALIITIILSIVPTVLYSGMLVPVSSLSHGTQLVAHLFPAMYYTDIVRGSFLKGIAWEVQGGQVLVLASYAMGLLTVGYALFRKRPSA